MTEAPPLTTRPPRGRAARRADRAARRLRAARRGFELSAAALRSAALDEVERHGLIRTVLRASLERRAQTCPADP
ncbi:hypothetical protein J2X36_004210 [Methylobacterium sp. BE186]|uniref:hypothetical protein n=1 Tax=Methylobacterium sp. BE186 TaxID=2817715 RepID=UPI0028653B80|nr:hypothetical protein [Methylobacterium sp. BE186]MDR7039434.1 hypothetical protein [Methylobacterium sp. BE186]